MLEQAELARKVGVGNPLVGKLESNIEVSTGRAGRDRNEEVALRASHS